MAAEEMANALRARWVQELDALIARLPEWIQEAVRAELPRHEGMLVDIVTDLGRPPMLSFLDEHGYTELETAGRLVTSPDIDRIDEGLVFDVNHRAALDQLLHRISAMGKPTVGAPDHVTGLTLRVGRAVPGAADLIADLIESGEPVLIGGPAGRGKSTLLRDAASVAGRLRRTVVVDKSGELGGDGDVPHPALGAARRIPCSGPKEQWAAMLQALTNHTPEAIIVDEIANAEEVAAAQQIAESGVQLIATVHTPTFAALVENHETRALLGADPRRGWETPTFGDKNMDKMGGKVGRRRVNAPMFRWLVLLSDRNTVEVYDLEKAVDAYLEKHVPQCEIRRRGVFVPIAVAQQDAVGGAVSAVVTTAGPGAEYATARPALTLAPLPDDQPSVKVATKGLRGEFVQRAFRAVGPAVTLVDSVEDADVVLICSSRERFAAGPALRALLETQNVRNRWVPDTPSGIKRALKELIARGEHQLAVG